MANLLILRGEAATRQVCLLSMGKCRRPPRPQMPIHSPGIIIAAFSYRVSHHPRAERRGVMEYMCALRSMWAVSRHSFAGRGGTVNITRSGSAYSAAGDGQCRPFRVVSVD